MSLTNNLRSSRLISAARMGCSTWLQQPSSKSSSLPIIMMVKRTLFGFGFGNKKEDTDPKVLALSRENQGSATNFSQRTISRYSQQQLFDLVSNVSEYKNFVPYCTDSKVIFKNDKLMLAKLTAGFGPVSESYTSKVTLQTPSMVTAISTDTGLFKSLSNQWIFTPTPTGCLIDFTVSFEFSSSMYTKLVGPFFSEIAHGTLAAFNKRCLDVYGPPKAIKP